VWKRRRYPQYNIWCLDSLVIVPLGSARPTLYPLRMFPVNHLGYLTRSTWIDRSRMPQDLKTACVLQFRNNKRTTADSSFPFKLNDVPDCRSTLTRQASLLPRETSQVIEPLYESKQVQIGHSCRLAELVVLGLTLSRIDRTSIHESTNTLYFTEGLSCHYVHIVNRVAYILRAVGTLLSLFDAPTGQNSGASRLPSCSHQVRAP
jgi:hypothetical protein